MKILVLACFLIIYILLWKLAIVLLQVSCNCFKQRNYSIEAIFIGLSSGVLGSILTYALTLAPFSVLPEFFK